MIIMKSRLMVIMMIMVRKMLIITRKRNMMFCHLMPLLYISDNRDKCDYHDNRDNCDNHDNLDKS